MRGLSLSCPWFPVLGRRWPLYSDDSGKIQFTENVNGGNAYRSKSIPFSRKEKQAPSRAAMESIGICVFPNNGLEGLRLKPLILDLLLLTIP